MDFARVFALVSGFAAEANVPVVLIGGLAMAAHGLPRTTFDLDIAADGERQDDLVGFLEASGYRTLHRSAGYSNHLHPDVAMGRVDVVYVRGATREALVAGALSLPGPNGEPSTWPQ